MTSSTTNTAASNDGTTSEPAIEIPDYVTMVTSAQTVAHTAIPVSSFTFGSRLAPWRIRTDRDHPLRGWPTMPAAAVADRVAAGAARNPAKARLLRCCGSGGWKAEERPVFATCHSKGRIRG